LSSEKLKQRAAFIVGIMKIRVAQLPDAKEIAQQNIAMAKESEDATIQYDIALAGVNSLLADKTKGFYLVAEERGRLIGQLMITFEWSDWRNQTIWWVQSVYVKKDWRNKGVFTKLLSTTQQLARTHNVAFLRLYVHQHNQSALQVYEKKGWILEPYRIYQHSI
jgi:GNAT superfamily N-acetyltransferase